MLFQIRIFVPHLSAHKLLYIFYQWLFCYSRLAIRPWTNIYFIFTIPTVDFYHGCFAIRAWQYDLGQTHIIFTII
jgi:hypothetical protein